MIKLIQYVKQNDHRPGMVGKVINAKNPNFQFSERELANAGWPVIFGYFTLDISGDEVVLCDAGRRAVNDIENPTELVAIGD